MEITLSLVGDIPVFHLAGRLDVTTSPLLEDRLKPMLLLENQRVVFDCVELNYISSAGLRVFISTLRNFRAKGGGLAFASLTPPVKDLFHLAGLQNLFLVEETLSAAVSRLIV